MDWEDAGSAAFDKYFNCYRKSGDHDEAQELAEEHFTIMMEDAGIGIETFWYEDIAVASLVSVATGFVRKYERIEKEHGDVPPKNFMGPCHTWFDDILSDALEIHQDGRLSDIKDEFEAVAQTALGN